MFAAFKNGLRDAADVLKHVRRPGEVVRALLPARVRGLRVLNEGSGGAAEPAEIAQRLRDLRGNLKAEALHEDGSVSYRALRGSATFRELERTASLLPGIDLSALKHDPERVAFWINLYNVLAIHGVIALGVERSVMEVPSFFSWVAYRVGEHLLTLDDIENGVLRANAPHPLTKRRLFTPDDSRLALLPATVDPRIHAALVCASTSCPAVRFYEAEQLDAQLNLACKAYVAGAVTVSEESVLVPITFRYYEQDFEPAGVQAFLLAHAPDDLRAALQQAFARACPLAYARYDWSINGRL